jgi:hypothetical protein
MIYMSYQEKYLKYKKKYIMIKNSIGGGNEECINGTKINVESDLKKNITYRYLGRNNERKNTIVTLTGIYNDGKNFKLNTKGDSDLLLPDTFYLPGNNIHKLLCYQNEIKVGDVYIENSENKNTFIINNIENDKIYFTYKEKDMNRSISWFQNQINTEFITKKITSQSSLPVAFPIKPRTPIETSQIIPFIEEQLKTIFNIHIKLKDYNTMKTEFNITSREKILPDSIIYTYNNIIYKGIKYDFNETYTDNCGGFNCIKDYTLNNNKFIFRYSDHLTPSQPDILFKSFYENLKHFILYIIVKHYFNNIKIIPKPIGMFFYMRDNVDSFGMLMEGGKYSFQDFMDKNKQTKTNVEEQKKYFKFLEGICAQIYNDLYILNSKPDIFQFKHNDLKPGNIVFSNTLIVKDTIPLIIDFGLSIFKIGSFEFICPENICRGYNSTKLQDKSYKNAIYDLITVLFVIYKTYIISYKMSNIYEIFFNLQDTQNIFHNQNIFDTVKNLSEQFNTQYQRFSEQFVLKYKDIKDIKPKDLYLALGITTLKARTKFEQKYLKYKSKYLQLKHKK